MRRSHHRCASSVKLIGRWLTALVFLAPGTAGAQGFGRPLQVAIGAERLMGVFSDHVTTEGPVPFGGDTLVQKETNSVTSVALLGQTTGRNSLLAGGQIESQPSPATTPRLALDIFAIGGLSIGGSVMYVSRSGSVETEIAQNGSTTSTEEDLNTLSTFLLSPRVGYAISALPWLALWPRLGVTHTIYKESGTLPGPGGTTVEASDTVTATELTVDGLVALSPASHMMITAGPYLELPLGASFSQQEDGEDVTDGAPDISYTSFGLWAGLGVFF